MKVLNNANISTCSAMSLPSVADVVYLPESIDELSYLILQLKSNNCKFYLLSSGSNVILNEHIVTPIISLMKVNEIMSFDGECFECGCSVRVQKFIRYAQNEGYGGIEFLFSLPASMGGCVYMNAGRGGRFKDQIMVNFIEKITYLDYESGEIVTESVNKNQFAHHASPYQSKNCVVLSCRLKLKMQSKEETEQKIKERIAHCKKVQDTVHPNCGSAFSIGNRFIFQLFRILKVRSGGAYFSRKTPDWISINGNATASDIKRLVNKMIFAHKLIGAKYKVEYKFFD